MTNKKIIFIIISAIILLLILFLSLKIGSKSKVTNNKVTVGDFKVWILNDNKDKFNTFLNDFKSINKKYSNKNFVVESFDNYDEYQEVLASAISK